jgi:hypothetical protein
VSLQSSLSHIQPFLPVAFKWQHSLAVALLPYIQILDELFGQSKTTEGGDNNMKYLE